MNGNKEKQPRTRDELIACCRYYKGEDKSPWGGVYDGGESQNMNMLWWYESIWVCDMLQGNIRGYDEYMIPEYKAYGLGHLGEGDGVPLSLKALLCNRFGKGAWDLKKEFTEFYNQYYGSNERE